MQAISVRVPVVAARPAQRQGAPRRARVVAFSAPKKEDIQAAIKVSGRAVGLMVPGASAGYMWLSQASRDAQGRDLARHQPRSGPHAIVAVQEARRLAAGGSGAAAGASGGSRRRFFTKRSLVAAEQAPHPHTWMCVRDFLW